MESGGSRIPDFSADSTSGDDLLDIQPEVNAFASLIASRDVSPPLSIGLFGLEGSGSGKRFFTGRIAGRVQQLAVRSREAPDASAFCSGIVQVHYNAWHHLGGNQWLSIVERTFEALDHSTKGSDASFIDSNQVLSGPLGTATRLRRELESSIEQTTRLLADAHSALHLATTAHESAVKALAAQVSQSKWAEVNRRFAMLIGADIEAAKAIDKAGRTIGLHALSKNAEQLDNVFEQAKTLGGRASLLTNSLKAQRYFGNLFLLLFGLLMIALLAFVARWMWGQLLNTKEWVDTLGKGLAGLSTLLGFLGVLVAAILRNKVSRAIDALQTHEQLLHLAIQQADEARTFSHTVSEHAVATSTREMEDCRNRMADAARNLAVAQHALDDFMADGPVRRVTDFYRQRMLLSGQDLGPGIVPTIREDFEVLSMNQDRFSDSSRLERIIFYIEDLDRCPSATVVDVLQAMSLFLAFPLFVVVITANPFWLIQSAGARYEYLLSQPESNNASSHYFSAGGLSFLEELIQIPFWIKPIGREGAKYIVRQRLGLASRTPHGDAPGAVEAEVPSSPDFASISSSDAPQPEALGPKDLQIEPAALQTQITEGEIAFIQEMAPFLASSPRQLRRLTNTYRLIRTGLSPNEMSTLLGDETRRPYSAVITMLALIIADPVGAGYCFDLLLEKDHPTQAELLDSISTGSRTDSPDPKKTGRKILTTYFEHRRNAQAIADLRAFSAAVMRYSFTLPPRSN